MIPKIVVVGYGSIGKRHLENLVSIGIKQITVISKKNKPNLKNLNEVEFLKNISQLKSNENNIAVICTPPSVHKQNFEDLLKKKIFNFYIEKPISNTVSSAIQILKLSQENNCRVFVGFDLRFDPGLNLINNLIKSNKLGKALFFSCEVGQNLRDWRETNYENSYSAKKSKGGGVMLDLIHEFDYLFWIFGRYDSLFGINKKISDLNIETEDISMNIVEFKNGVLGRVSLDYIQKHFTRKMKVVFEKGTLVWNYNKSYLTKYTKNKKVNIEFTTLERNSRFKLIMKTFLNKILKNEESKLLVNIEESIYSLKIVEELKKSNSLNKKIII